LGNEKGLYLERRWHLLASLYLMILFPAWEAADKHEVKLIMATRSGIRSVSEKGGKLQKSAFLVLPSFLSLSLYPSTFDFVPPRFFAVNTGEWIGEK
jgi:hypothetical protein